jgi:ubiquitin-conjugating enzyme E2 G1
MSMDTTASLLLKKQLAELMKSPDSGNCHDILFFALIEIHMSICTGFSAGLVDDNDIFKWEVLIIGPPDTLYEGGFFKGNYYSMR